ncbi:MAG: endonuclease domain-containing protein [Proteobacteria bacterium]|nr:endonuclease domain-containing protein [Pseudomonadota bacterium]
MTMDNNALRGLARDMRKNPTDAERKLWLWLRANKWGHLRRQHTIGNYMVDFVFIKQKLVIECDGNQHNEIPNASYDKKRTQFLESQGYKVLRFWNEDILKNTDWVVDVIRNNMENRMNEISAGMNKPSPAKGWKE